jgi:hypothetical protein
MTAAPSIELRATTSHETVRSDLLDVYAAVRAPLLHLPNYAVTAFGERLDRHGSEPGFTAVLAYAEGQPIGYAYCNTIERGNRYWQRTSPEPAATYTERPAASDGKVHAFYKTWVYEDIGHGQPSADSPVLTVMIRATDG